VSQSLARALAILTELGEGGRALDELAALLAVHKTTVLRLLRTLEDERFVYRDSAHRYHLGARLFALSSQAMEQRNVRAIAAPHLARLNRSSGHTVHLGAYENGEAVYLDKYDSRHPVRMYSRIGLPMPLHCTGIGKVLLAGLPAAERDELIAWLEYPVLTPNTIDGPAAMRAELERVAAQGYAVDHGEHEPAINCVAAPIRDAGGQVIAAVSLSVPTVVLAYEQVLHLVPDLLGTATAISAECGHHPREGRK
jgi:DNA-binding IclR family transcriptional regulator